MKAIHPMDCELTEVESRLALGCRPGDIPEAEEERRTDRHQIVGTVRVREHCEFTWLQNEGDTRRYVRGGGACDECERALAGMLGDDLRLDRRRSG